MHVDTLGDALPREIKRAQQLIVDYRALGPVGSFGAMMIQQDIDAAIKALAEGDVVAMIRAYNELKRPLRI